jgi:hypothetical protein
MVVGVPAREDEVLVVGFCEGGFAGAEASRGVGGFSEEGEVENTATQHELDGLIN